MARAREVARRGDAQEALELLRRHLARAGADAAAHRALADVYSGIGMRDAAAHHLALAIELLEARGDAPGARRTLADLRRADPLSGRRERHFRDVTQRLHEAAARLVEHGHPERALDLLERLAPIAAGRDAQAVEALRDRLRAASRRVDLDAEGQAEPADGPLPLIRHESEHYRFEANLEAEVLERLGRTMDAIHAYYVDVFFDGDARKARSAKATIRIHPSWDSLAAEWTGGRGSAPQGWWSPGQNRVVCYDTRSNAGTLDVMLATLFHEASHQFTTLLARGGRVPAWLNEGTASFFEGAVAMADDRVLWPDAALPRLLGLTAALRNPGSDTPSLADVIGYEQPGSYPASYYAWGWGLVYFLQQYEDPETSRYVYRPLYARYREEALRSPRGSAELFGELLLGEASPLGHGTLEDFERDWRRWILEEVAPLHVSASNARRELRLARARRYLEAADAADVERRPKVPAAELLARALGDLEYVRSELDGQDRPDGELILLQADVLIRLSRRSAAAPLVEQALELADLGRFELDEERYGALERRLKDLDASNWALRTARSRVRGLSRAALRLLEEYHAQEPAMVLRAYTFAAGAAGALGDPELVAAAAELRGLARATGLLVGHVEPLAARRRDAWYTLVTAEPRRFEPARGTILLEAHRLFPMVTPDVEPGLDYELRGVLERRGELFMGAAHGFVLAAEPGGGAWLAGVTDDGDAAVWRIRRLAGGGARTDRVATLPLEPALAPDETIPLAVRVLGGRELELRAGERPAVRYELPEALPSRRHVGVFVKDGVLFLSDPLVELLP